MRRVHRRRPGLHNPRRWCRKYERWMQKQRDRVRPGNERVKALVEPLVRAAWEICPTCGLVWFKPDGYEPQTVCGYCLNEAEGPEEEDDD